MKTINIIAIFLLCIILSSCAILERMEKEHLEKELQEITKMKSYNSGIVNFHKEKMIPLLKDKGRLLSASNFTANDPNISAEEQFVEISWRNTGFPFSTEPLNLNIKKSNAAQSILISRYRNYIEKKGGTVKEEGINKAEKIIKKRNCKYSAPLFGYIKNNLDSVYLYFICHKETIFYDTRRKDKRKIAVPLLEVHFRIVNGVIAKDRLFSH